MLGITGGDPEFRDDDGAADPAAARALLAFGAGQGSEHAALTALAASRLLVPVVAMAASAASEMAMPTLIGMDGRRAIPAFTCLDSMRRWQADARPVPVAARLVWQAAAADSAAVVIDVAGPVPMAVEGARLAALARGEPAPPPERDPDIRDAIAAALADQLDVAEFQLGPGDAERDLEIGLILVPGTATGDPGQRASLVGEAVQARLGTRLRRGVAIWFGARQSLLAGQPSGPTWQDRHMLRWLTAGESHGPALVAICEGLPAGVEVTTADLAIALARRRAGYGRGARMKFEQDEVEITGGVRHGRTLGGPVALRVANSEWPKWVTVMSADPVPEDALEGLARNDPLTRPRPGHADLAGMQKYSYDDARPVLERASARETAARVALGEVARRFLGQALGAAIVSHVVAIGAVSTPNGLLPGPDDLAAIDADPVRCFDPSVSAAMVAEIDAARRDGDTLGGVAEVVVHRLPPGLGSHVHWDRRLDGRLAGAMMSIHAIKGVEIGDGFATAARRGSAAHDEISSGPDGLRRLSNRAGGIEGGMSTGDPIRVRVAMKPISTVPRALATVDVRTGEPARAINQRSDVTAVPAAAVVAEAMAALVLANAALEKFGGDSIAETRRNLTGYLDSLEIR